MPAVADNMPPAARAAGGRRSAAKALPRLATLYLAVIGLAAAILGVAAVVETQPLANEWVRFALLTGLASVAQLLSVEIGRHRAFHPAMVFVVAGILLLPAELVALMCVVQHLPEWAVKRYAWYIQSFNIANYVVAGVAAAAASTAIIGTGGATHQVVLGGIAACVVFLGLNRCLLACMLRLARFRSFRETNLFSHEDIALELVLASMGIPLAAFWIANAWLTPIALAPLALIYYAQRSSLSLFRASETIRDQNEALEEANRLLIERSTAAMESLSATVDARDAYTAGHSRRVRAISLRIGEELELDQEQLETLGSASLLHDIGKIGIPDAVLLKAGPLSDEEWTVMRSHAAEGARIIERLGFLAEAVPAIRHHHERPDGQGYPDGLSADQIPVLARIIHVADAFDSMVTTRTYRPAQSLDYALSELRRGSGTQFCGDCVAALERALGHDDEERAASVTRLVPRMAA